MKIKRVNNEDELKYDVKTRVNSFHYDRLQHMLAQSHYRTMAELLREILCNGKINIATHDESLDLVMEQLTRLRREINSIGVNLNQIARLLHSSQKKGTRELQAVELIPTIKDLHVKMDTQLDLISQLSARWLQ